MSAQQDFSGDWLRPSFHFMPQANWMNDPNGLIQWNGTYHMFYQYNPHGAFHATMHWGHAKSEDLVHWEHLPIALAPSPDGPDADGIFSGCAVSFDGVPTLLYTGVRGDAQLPCIATSQDADLVTWEKHPRNPVIDAPPSELHTTIFRDHSAWREGDTWYQVIGSGVQGVGGTALLYRSPDLLRWEFVGSLVPLERVREGVGEDATGWECPDFFALDGRHALIVSMWDHRAINVSYFIGDYHDHQFTPAHQGLVDSGQTFYAPQSFTDDQGRRIMFGWLREGRSVETQIAAGWSGVMSLPRVLSVLPDGSLGTAPAPEIMQLRGAHLRLAESELPADGNIDLGPIRGNACELALTLAPSTSGTLTLDLLKASDDSERTRVTYDAAAGTVTVDTRESDGSGAVEGNTFSLQRSDAGNPPSRLRAFVDHSVIEVFLDDEKCISARAYPSSPESTGIGIRTDSATPLVEEANVWGMGSSRTWAN